MRVSAGLVIVGDLVADATRPSAASAALASPKSSTFTVPSVRTFTFAGFRSRCTIAVLVRCFQRYSDLSGDRQRFIDGQRAELESVGDCLAVHQFEHERPVAVRFLEPVDRRDVRMIERCENGLRA